jgi:hypothetical protein
VLIINQKYHPGYLIDNLDEDLDFLLDKWIDKKN